MSPIKLARETRPITMTQTFNMNKFEDYKCDKNFCGISCPKGWEFLVESFIDFTQSSQNQYLYLNEPTEKAICGKSDRPFFEFKIQQIKQKFGALIIYYSIQKVEHDWDKFNKEKYEEVFKRDVAEIRGYSYATESMSTKICEETGERGSRCEKDGWYRTLSPQKAKELGFKILGRI